MDEKKIADYWQEALHIAGRKEPEGTEDVPFERLSIRCFDSIDSTNTFGKQWIDHGVKLPALALTDAQTQGRGRLGRNFFSPLGGLYMSIITECQGIDPGMLTTLAAVCVLSAAEVIKLPELQIKWVNDILLLDKKVGGILAEGILSQGSLKYAVIGIGLNTGEINFPEDLKHIAGSLKTGKEVIDREKLAVLITRLFLEALPHIPDHMLIYRRHCASIGQELRFVQDDCTYFGTAIEVDDSGALLVQTQTGLMRLETGEVSIRNAGGSYS